MRRIAVFLILCTLLLPAVSLSETLRYGSSGDAVMALQQRLTELGYYADIPSGNYLDNTLSAVKRFQQQNGLDADGIAGSATQGALFSEGAVDAYSQAKRAVPYQIGVDVTNQVVTIYELDDTGEFATPIKRMLCSTGTEKDPTPPGSYILNGATSRWCYFPKWGTHAQYWTRIDAYNAFHSVIYSEPNSKALAVSSYTGLGKRASHGCIRLMLEDAKWIYENCGKGTEVVVYEGEVDEEQTMALKIPPLDKSVMLPEPTPQPTMTPTYDPGVEILMPTGTLSYGMEGEVVYFLQCRLAELGYYGGTLSGGFYAGTEAAVKAFQRDQGLPESGAADETTVGRMYAELMVRAMPTPEPTVPAGLLIEMPWFEPREREWAE